MESGKKVILIVSGRAFNLYRSRLPLMKLLISQGWEVHAAGYAHDNYDQLVRQAGVIFHDIKFVRAKVSLIRDISTLISLIKLQRLIKPDYVHYFNTKPILISGLIPKFTIYKSTSACTLTGIGFHRKSLKNSIIKKAIKLSLSKKDIIIFENNQDRDLCLKLGLKMPKTISVQISSGVDVKKYKSINTIDERIIILFAGRLVKSKGINELLASSRKLKNEFGDFVNIKIAGELDPAHPDGFSESELLSAVDKGYVEYLGVVSPDKMHHLMKEVNIVVLPSYREGFSKVLMEAAASGKALAASDVPGCREIVIDGKNGVLFESMNEDSIYTALKYLISNPSKILEFGIESRKQAIKYYDHNILAQQTLDLYLQEKQLN